MFFVIEGTVLSFQERQFFYESVPLLGTFSNADFCDGESYRKSKLFPVDVLHFAGKPSSLRAEVTAASFPLYKM